MPELAEIIKLFGDKENSSDFQEQEKLMEEAEFVWNNQEDYLSKEGADALFGLQHALSNDPRTFADMAIAILSELKIRTFIPITDQQKEEREVDSWKERFGIGIRKAADENLANLLLPSLQDAYSWQAAIRGRVAGPWLLGKDKEKKTFVHIKAWDTTYVKWGMGRKG